MRKKVEAVSDVLVNWMDPWPGVEAVSLADTADVDPFDPYFTLALDVYYREDLPSADIRESWLVDHGAAAFETSQVHSKDRFLLEELPIRIEYKEVSHIEDVVKGAETPAWLFKEKGTYLFYRLQRGHILRDSRGWITGIQQQLGGLSDQFWQTLRISSQTKMEHYLSDFGAAVFRKDRLYYYVSISGFLRSLCKTLFALNHVFEPSPRMFTPQVTALEKLPPGFEANYNSLLRADEELDPDRKWEIGNLLAKSIIEM